MYRAANARPSLAAGTDKTTTFGTKALTAGVHEIRLTAASKNASSSNFYVSADSFILEKQ